MLPFRFFFLMRLPPLFELPRTQSRPSRLHLSHGGEPPDASLVKLLVDVARIAGVQKWCNGMLQTLTGRICSVFGQYVSTQHVLMRATYLSLTTEDACSRDSFHGRRRAILSHLELPSTSNCRRRPRMRME